MVENLPANAGDTGLSPGLGGSHMPLTVAASLVAEHRLQTRRLSSCGSRAQLLRGMWDLPRPGLKPVSPALAGRFSTTAPPGKPHIIFYAVIFSNKQNFFWTLIMSSLKPSKVVDGW